MTFRTNVAFCKDQISQFFVEPKRRLLLKARPHGAWPRADCFSRWLPLSRLPGMTQCCVGCRRGRVYDVEVVLFGTSESKMGEDNNDDITAVATRSIRFLSQMPCLC